MWITFTATTATITVTIRWTTTVTITIRARRQVMSKSWWRREEKLQIRQSFWLSGNSSSKLAIGCMSLVAIIRESSSTKMWLKVSDFQFKFCYAIINAKSIFLDQKSAKTPSHLTLEFRVFLKSAKTDQHTQESRILRFWFRDWLTDGERKAHVAQDFFRELVSPKEFPRGLNVRCAVSYWITRFNLFSLFSLKSDYVGFIKKIMKQLQKGYNEIQSVEIELTILEQTSAPPSRPREYSNEQSPSILKITPQVLCDATTVKIKRVRFVDEVFRESP